MYDKALGLNRSCGMM